MVSTNHSQAPTESDWHEPIHWYANRGSRGHAVAGRLGFASGTFCSAPLSPAIRCILPGRSRAHHNRWVGCDQRTTWSRLGLQKHKIEPETSGMEGMVVCCRGSLVGRRASAPPEAGEGIASSNYERKGSRIGGLLAGFGADRIIRRVGLHDRCMRKKVLVFWISSSAGPPGGR